jgi:hypothetical protein
LAVIVGILLCGALLLDRRPALYEALDGQDTPGAPEVDITDDDTRLTDDSTGTAPGALATAAITNTGAPSLRLEIRTTGLCWVSASADGERAVYRLMQAGERTRVEAHRVITLRVGDAGAFAYTVNGGAGRPLGRSGEAVTIRLTNDNLESLYAKPASLFPAAGAHDSTGHRDLKRQWPAGDRGVSSPEKHARRVFAESGQAHRSQCVGQALQTGFDWYIEARNWKGVALLLQGSDGRAAILKVVGDQGGSA